MFFVNPANLSQKWFVDIIGNQGIHKTRSLALLMGEIVVLNKNLVITQISMIAADD